MNRIVLQFAGLWLGASGVLCYAQWNGPTFGNTYRVAQADLALPPAPTPAEMAPMEAPVTQDSVLSAPPAEAGAPMQAGPIGYEGAGYGYGGTFGGDTCCDPMDPCAATLWDGYWGAKHHWCQKGHGCGCGHHGLLPQVNWVGGGCAHRACWGAGVGGHGCGAGCGHGLGGGLFGGHGFGGHGVACCEEEVASDCGCEPSGCGHHCFLPQLNWVGGGCAHRACFGAGVVGHGHGMGGHGLLGHGHGVGVMEAGCSECGN